MLNDAVKIDIENSVLCWLATVDDDGMPNVSPKEIFTWFGDDRVLIADIASPQSVSNVRRHPSACVSFVDVFRQRGFKLKGNAIVLTPVDHEFDVMVAPLRRLAGPGFPVRSAIVITVTKVARIWAPSYALYPDQSEQARINQAYATYGVRPLSE